MNSKINSRKTAIKAFLAGGVGLLSYLSINKLNLFDKKPKEKKKRLTMLMDLDKCIGCNACSVACKSENGVALGGFRTKVLEEEVGEFPATQRHFLPMMCNHCENPACLPACPNGAITRGENGIVDINKDKCKGFQLCIQACPYGAIYINPDTKPDTHVKDYPSRSIGKADKCNFCAHRIDEGLESACSQTCPTDARVFGDLNDPSSLVAKIINEEGLKGLLEEEGTKPQVYYKGGLPSAFPAKKGINKPKY